jgi:hypothetical protein
MPLAQNLTSLTPQTAERLVVHSGVAFRNANIDELRENGFAAAVATSSTWEISDGEDVRTVSPQPFGATRGGFTINPGITVTPIEDIDGTLGPVKGLVEITGFAPTIQGTLVEMADYTKIKEMLSASDVVLCNSGLWNIVPRTYVDSTDHLGNITIACQTSNSTTSEYWVVVLHNPLGKIDSHQLQRGVNSMQITYQGYAALASPLIPPIEYFVPRIGTEGSGS